MKPTIRTDCPAATNDEADRQTAELHWPVLHGPAPSTRTRAAGALLQLGSTTLENGRPVALLDLYRADAEVLVRCSPHHVQAPAAPLGTTLGQWAARQLALQQVALLAARVLPLLQCTALERAAERGELQEHAVQGYEALYLLHHSLQHALAQAGEKDDTQ